MRHKPLNSTQGTMDRCRLRKTYSQETSIILIIVNVNLLPEIFLIWLKMLALFKIWIQSSSISISPWSRKELIPYLLSTRILRIAEFPSLQSSIVLPETWTWSRTRKTNSLTCPRIQIPMPTWTILKAILNKIILFRTIQKRQLAIQQPLEAFKTQESLKRSLIWALAMVQSSS